VALATVADVAALTGLNRAFVIRGLEVMRLRPRIGIKALIETARIDGKLRPYHLGFMLGPRINAGGRIGDAALGARLMIEADPDRARRLAAELDRLNGERQAQEQTMLVEAEMKAAAIFRASNNVSCLIVGDKTWHPGIVGLLASRLKEKFKIPSFAIAFNDKTGTGSGRSLTGVDLGRAVRMAVDQGHAVRGGGHAMAAGVTIAAENLEAFTTFMHEQLDEHVTRARGENVLTIDAAITSRAVTTDVITRVEMAGPFGQGNPEPVFLLSGQVIADAALVGSDHVRVRLQASDGARLNAISFRSAETELGQALLGGRGARFHLAARLSVGQFRGVERVDCHIVDAAPSR
jgi:single-stranded-DNA-specific exonuclease